MANSAKFNLIVVAQRGRLAVESVLLAASLHAQCPEFTGQFIVAEPQPNARWSFDPRIGEDVIYDALDELGAQVVPFENVQFGEDYPNANKAECLHALPEGEPFLFLDTDTLVTGDLGTLAGNLDRPSASMLRTATWPKIELYGPSYDEIWGALYEKFELNFETTLDLSHPDGYWQRYLYFNAGWFCGPCPQKFAQLYTDIMLGIRDTPPDALVCQQLYPWLDQIALPLVIHALGGGRPDTTQSRLDGELTRHYRALPLLYATASNEIIAALEALVAPNRIKRALKTYEPWKRVLYQGRGERARALFQNEPLPRHEQALRNRLRREKLWFR